MKTYSELKELPAELHKALVDLNFTTPTPIQEKAIPLALTGRDLIGCAATGTGKTAAFLIPTLTKLNENADGMALILVPTRELALQVGEVHRDLTKYLRGIPSATLIGGVPMSNQIKAIQRKPRVIVATPGRLLDHLKRGTFNLKRLQVLVLDEADRMLDMGFQPQLKEILRFLPDARQTLFFSATLPKNILELSQRYVKNPLHVDVKTAQEKTAEANPTANIDEQTLSVEQKGKNEALLDQLNTRVGSVLVFARTQSRVDRVCRYLESYEVSVARIHGGRTQGQRIRALDGFRDGQFRVLIATDLASRGIDVDHIAHVINFDLPQAPEDYIHRIGRTGRAGRTGEAISFVTREDAPMWRSIERLKSGVLNMGPPGANRASSPPRSGNGANDGSQNANRSARNTGNRRGPSGSNAGGGSSGGNSGGNSNGRRSRFGGRDSSAPRAGQSEQRYSAAPRGNAPSEARYSEPRGERSDRSEQSREPREPRSGGRPESSNTKRTDGKTPGPIRASNRSYGR